MSVFQARSFISEADLGDDAGSSFCVLGSIYT